MLQKVMKKQTQFKLSYAANRKYPVYIYIYIYGLLTVPSRILISPRSE